MMWMVKPNSHPAWEPLELIILKQKLAKLSSSICKCLSDRPDYADPAAFHTNPNDKKIQVEEQKSSSFDRFTQANQASTCKDREDLSYSLTKDVLCPGCFVTMNLLRAGALKTLKDEESETKNDMFSCDKATEKIVKSVEKTTSFTIKQKVMFSDISLYEMCDSSLTFNHEDKRNLDHVQVCSTKFAPNMGKFGQVMINSHQQTSLTDAPPCFCLEKFVDSIRPPIMNSYAY